MEAGGCAEDVSWHMGYGQREELLVRRRGELLVRRRGELLVRRRGERAVVQAAWRAVGQVTWLVFAKSLSSINGITASSICKIKKII